MKILPLGAELPHSDGQAEGKQTDMTKGIVTFNNFARKRPKKEGGTQA